MPPKNMISVARNSHMPNDEASRCCSMSTKWCLSAGFCCSTAIGLSAIAGLLRSGNILVVVSFPIDHRGTVKIKSWWRRKSHPLQAGSAPGIVRRNFSIAHGPQEIHHRQKISDRENSGSGGRENVQPLEFRRILPVAARHPQVAQDELGEKCQVESQEHNDGSQPAQRFRIHAS